MHASAPAPAPAIERWSLSAPLTLALLALLTGSCSKGEREAASKRTAERAEPGKNPEQLRAEREQRQRQRERAQMEKQFPLHGLVTGMQLTIHEGPDPASTVVGWLRLGARIRLAPGPRKSPTCNTGWHRVHPRGWACAGEGIRIAPDPPRVAADAAVAAAEPEPGALPYRYYFVTEPLVPEYYRLPSRDEQRAARAFAARYLELKRDNERKTERFFKGELAGEPAKPAVVFQYLERGFFVAGAGIETRAFRRFVRTVRGRYLKLAPLEERRGSEFAGVNLDAERTLPVAWAIRSGRPFRVELRQDGSPKLLGDETSEPIARLTLLPWVGQQRLGGRIFHQLKDGRYLKHWFVAVARKIDPPEQIKADEPWVHIDLGQQTLVLYRGPQPVYATLVSTGLEGFDTPAGVYSIRAKYVAETMSDLGPDAGDERYKIEDVPYTQYFSGSLALHGAFWHERFGLRRSHGCVNLSPADARRVFEHTAPRLPEGWHGVSTDRTDFRASQVVITGAPEPDSEADGAESKKP